MKLSEIEIALAGIGLGILLGFVRATIIPRGGIRAWERNRIAKDGDKEQNKSPKGE